MIDILEAEETVGKYLSSIALVDDELPGGFACRSVAGRFSLDGYPFIDSEFDFRLKRIQTLSKLYR